MAGNQKNDEFSLPFDVKTLLVSLKRRWYWFLLIILFAGGLGIMAGLEYGESIYEASTVMNYTPSSKIASDEFEVLQNIDENTSFVYRQGAQQLQDSLESMNIETQKNLVKIPSNLEEVRNQLNLPTDPSSLGSSIDVSITRGTNLMTISARSQDAEMAVKIAETMRNVFLEMNKRINKGNMKEWIDNLENNYRETENELREAEQKLQEYIDTYNITDSEIMTEEYIRQMVEVEISIQNMETELNVLTKQLKKVSTQIEEEEDLYRPGNADYISSLKLKKIDLEMAALSLEERLSSSRSIYKELSQQVSALPEIKEAYIQKKTRVNGLKAEFQGLEKMYAQAQELYDKGISDFTVISDPQVPIYPISSTKKLLAIAGAFLVGVMGLAVLLLLELLNTRIKSDRDAAQKTRLPVLGSLPRVRNTQALIPDATHTGVHIEQFRIMARPLRIKYKEFGTVFLISSTKKNEGKTTAAVNLASVYGRRDERVLLMDAQIRKRKTSLSYAKILEQRASDTDAEEAVPMGLGEYLSYMANEAEEIIEPTVLPGVDTISVHTEAVIPDILQSNRMKTLIDELKKQYSIIIIEAPDVLSYVDAEILSEYSDAVLFVLRCNTAKSAQVKKAVERLKQAPAPIEGLIVTDIDSAYL
ncbi:MAG: AAA family ATPase [Spirochaetales bacterium]|nr:AAA family ATPase [Spirochaetales bacterium]